MQHDSNGREGGKEQVQVSDNKGEKDILKVKMGAQARGA